ncbi:hypothetical protein [Pseudofrankia sp. DC12]|uniref:hypothetical protein n=1 Tax=Pseudofrankia sp. DC12 TaxID=683315 RepID=UPI0005F796C9|nr:hypothetical protein [Pseudofrankia sp. DC12]
MLGLLWRQVSSEQGALALAVLVAVVAAGSVLLVRGGASLPWADLLVLAGGLVVAWLTVVADLAIGVAKAAALLNRANSPFDLARPLPRWILDRARRTESANVVIYGKMRKKDPFVGSGDRLGGFPIVVDVTRGKDSGDGDRATPEPIDVAALHRFLRTSAASVKISGLWCGHRLYVDGMAVGGFRDLVPDRARPPVTELPHDRLLEELHSPHPKRRAYLCLQLTGWDGELVVTMFVRAELSANLLMVEVSAHGLLPVDESWLGDVSGLVGPRERAWDILRSAARQTLGALFASPRKCGAGLAEELGHRRRSARDARARRPRASPAAPLRLRARVLAAGGCRPRRAPVLQLTHRRARPGRPPPGPAARRLGGVLRRPGRRHLRPDRPPADHRQQHHQLPVRRRRRRQRRDRHEQPGRGRAGAAAGRRRWHQPAGRAAAQRARGPGQAEGRDSRELNGV